MKGKSFLIFLTFILFLNVSVPDTSGQYVARTQFSLPEGTKARLGNGLITGGLAYSSDGTFLAVSSSVGIWLYDATTYQEVALLTGHTEDVTNVVFSPDSTLLASTSSDETVRLWNVSTGENIHTFKGHASWVDAVAFSSTGAMLASTGEDGSIRLWNVSTGENIHTFKGHTGWARSVAFSPDGTTLASGGEDATVRLLNLLTGENILTIQAHSHWVRSVAFSPDGTTLASLGWGETSCCKGDSGWDQVIRLWDVSTGENIRMIEGTVRNPDFRDFTYAIHSASFSPDGTIIASGTLSHIQLWDVLTGENIQTLRISGNGTNIIGIAFSPDGTTIACANDRGYSDNTVQLWDVETGEKTHTLAGHTRGVFDVAFSPDGTTLASAGGPYGVHLWDMQTGENIQPFFCHSWGINFSPDSSTLACGLSLRELSEDGGWSYLNVTYTYTKEDSISSTYTDQDHLMSVSFSPDGLTLASGHNYGLIRLWDVETGENIRTFEGHAEPVISVSFSPNGLMLASAGGGYGVHLWDVETGENIQTLAGHTGGVFDVSFSPDGLTLASASVDRTVRLWNVETAENIHTLDGHTGAVNSVVFSSNGATIASAGWDYTIRLWDTQTGENIQTFQVPTKGVLDIAFSPDGTTLASGNDDGTILLWDLTPILPELPHLAVDVNADGHVNIQDLVAVAAAFGETGKTAVDVNADGHVNIQDLVAVAAAFGEPVAGAPSAVNLSAENVQQWLLQAQGLTLTDATSQRGIRTLQQLLRTLTPKETLLLANYPNPFNPETWIPYQLAAPTDVIIHIHGIDGTLVRTLFLGHKAAGAYQTRSRAAYWDGRNNIGEPVASGVYFYTLTAGEFSATRKMLIRK